MPEENVFLNGEIVPLSRAVIPVTDRAVMFGDSVFETVRAYGGKPFRLGRHLERLAENCRLMRTKAPCGAGEIEAAVSSLLEANGLAGGVDAYIRITVTGGPSGGSRSLDRPGPQGLFILAHEYVPFTEEQYRRGLSLAVTGIKRNTSSPLSSNKTGNCMDSLYARQDALDRGQDDAVMLTTGGNLAEGPFSNLFMVNDGELLTPNMGCAFLPGITRETVIELALEGGIPVREIMEGLETLMASDEVFLTSSTMEIMPVSQVGTRELTFCPGPITQRLREAYSALTQS